MKKEKRLNQCQDCGCPGAQLMLKPWEGNLLVVECPYCKRRGVPFIGNEQMFDSWNPYNRENKEGLA